MGIRTLAPSNSRAAFFWVDISGGFDYTDIRKSVSVLHLWHFSPLTREFGEALFVFLQIWLHSGNRKAERDKPRAPCAGADFMNIASWFGVP